MAQIIDGKAIASTLRQEVRASLEDLPGPPPLIVAVEVGHDEASAAYTRNQARTAEKVGLGHRLDTLPRDATVADLQAHFEDLARDAAVTGIMLQTPLPKHLDAAICRGFIPAEKDIEAVTVWSAGRLLQRTHQVAPCTAMAALRCLEVTVAGEVAGLDVCIVGRSEIVGRPLALLLLHANATVTVCHTKTRDLADKARRADVVFAAAGRAGLVTADMVRPGAIVIDVGTNWDAATNRLVGDVDFEPVEKKARAITPVPGGVGPVTVAMLMRNAVALAAGQRCG